MEQLNWKKSTFSGPNTDACVEVAVQDEDSILVRDSKNPEGGVLTFNGREWDAFVKGTKAGQFDL
jgi:hypothetical protein